MQGNPKRPTKVAVVTHDGKQIAGPFEGETETKAYNAAWQFVHRHQGNSVDYALRHGGYRIVVTDKDGGAQ